ncbi:hypothetical protein [Shewanella colwelliana]|uniref:hypothetical protein n=1 Tax=Shewanella colwelliana TaxID=23 RepID=UPI0037369E3D
MKLASSHIKLKLIEFFNNFDYETKVSVYKLLAYELKSLIADVQQLNAEEKTEINTAQHKFKGICQYLKIDSDFSYCKNIDKTNVLSNLCTVQCILKEAKSEIM